MTGSPSPNKSVPATAPTARDIDPFHATKPADLEVILSPIGKAEQTRSPHVAAGSS